MGKGRLELWLCMCREICTLTLTHRFLFIHRAGLDFAHRRDQDVRLDFPTLAKALEKVALGEVRVWGVGVWGCGM